MQARDLPQVQGGRVLQAPLSGAGAAGPRGCSDLRRMLLGRGSDFRRDRPADRSLNSIGRSARPRWLMQLAACSCWQPRAQAQGALSDALSDALLLGVSHRQGAAQVFSRLSRVFEDSQVEVCTRPQMYRAPLIGCRLLARLVTELSKALLAVPAACRFGSGPPNVRAATTSRPAQL